MSAAHRIAVLLCAAIGLLADTPVRAEGVFGLHVASVHIPGHDGQNNTNLGAYFRFESGWVAGAYTNTQNKTSLYGGYSFELGPVDVVVGVVSGYQEKCTSEIGVTGRYTKTTELEGGAVRKESGSTFGPIETCTGFSRGYLAPMVVPSIAMPFSLLGATPRIWFMPSLGKTDSVLHLSVEYSF